MKIPQIEGVYRALHSRPSPGDSHCVCPVTGSENLLEMVGNVIVKFNTFYFVKDDES
jgi:hypothetical protein